MGFITRADHVVERTKGDPGELRGYRADVRAAATLMESLAEMIDSVSDGRVQGDGFTVAAVRQNAGENSTILRAASEMFDRGGAAHGRYAAALEQNQADTSLQMIVISTKHELLVAAQAALDAAPPELKPPLVVTRDRAEDAFNMALDAFDRLVEQNFDDQTSCGSAVMEAAGAFHLATKSIDGYAAASNIMAGIAAVAGIVSLALGGPVVAGVAWTAGAVSAGLMAKLWLDGERSTGDMLIETAGIVPIVGLFGRATSGLRAAEAVADVADAAGVARIGGMGDESLDLIRALSDGTAAARIEVRMTPEAATHMRRESAEWAREANRKVPTNATVPQNLDAGGQPLFSTVELQHKIRGGTTQVHDFSVENLQSIRASLPEEKLNHPRFDPTHPEYFGVARGGSGISGPVLPNASPSVTELTNKGALINGQLPDELAPLITGPDSPLVLDYGVLRVRGITEIDVPASFASRDSDEMLRQLALTENGTNDTSVRDALAQLEEYRAKTHRIDPHSAWKQNMNLAFINDEASRGVSVTMEEARRRYSDLAGIHSPDQVGGGDGYGVAGWGHTHENGRLGSMWQHVRGNYASTVRQQLESAGIPEGLWDDIRMNVQFNLSDVDRARVGLRE